MAAAQVNGAQHRASAWDPEYQAGGPLSEKLQEHPTGIVKWADRLDHFTFAWYNVTTATGGIAALLSVQPHQFDGLITIGKIIYILNVVVFIVITSLIVARFARNPAKIKLCINNTTEALFIPTFFLSIAVIVEGMNQYGVPSTGYWLDVAVRVIFWIYTPVAFLWAVFQYWYLFSAFRMTVQSMTPAWILPIFPVMLSGTLASAITAYQPPEQALPILVAGATFQGLGFWVALLMYSAFINRLMESGLPGPNLRPGMFISVGPPSFTGLALIGMANNIPNDYGYFRLHPTAAEALTQLALAFAIFIWALALWFFFISLISCLWTARKMSFHLIWYAIVFPNVGFTTAIIQIGNELHSSTIGWVGSVLTIVLVCMWLFVMGAHARAVLKGQILWPGKDEDKDE